MKSPTHSLYEIACAAIRLWQKRELLLFALFLFSFLHPVLSQNTASIAVTGAVRDSSGAGMPNVTVTERGAKNATTTTADPNSITLNVAIPAITPMQNYVYARVGFKIAGVEHRIFHPWLKSSFSVSQQA